MPTAAADDENNNDDKKKGYPPRYIYLFHCTTHGLKAVRNQLLKLKKKAAESMCNEMKLKGDILFDTNNDEVIGLSRSG